MNLERTLERRGVSDQPQPIHMKTIGEAVLSQSAVASLLGITRARVAQIEERAIKKLRMEIESRAALAGVSVAEWMEVA